MSRHVITVEFSSLLHYRLPVSILYKSIAGRYRPVRVADGPITARYRFIKNASWAYQVHPCVVFNHIIDSFAAIFNGTAVGQCSD